MIIVVEIFERSFNMPKSTLKERIAIIDNYGPGVRGTKTQHPVGPSR